MLLGLVMEFGTGASGWTVANRTPLMNGNATTEIAEKGKLESDLVLYPASRFHSSPNLGPSAL